jgi:hypothetical protein
MKRDPIATGETCTASNLVVAYAPSKTPVPAKNWGLTSLSQGAAIPRKRLLRRRRWTERSVPKFSPRPLSPRVFIPIVNP